MGKVAKKVTDTALIGHGKGWLWGKDGGGGGGGDDPFAQYQQYFQMLAGQITPEKGQNLGQVGKLQQIAMRQQLFLAERMGPKFEKLRQKLINANPTAKLAQQLTNKSLKLLGENMGPSGLELDSATSRNLKDSVRSALGARGGLFSGAGAVTEASNLISGSLNLQGQRINNVLSALSGTQIPSSTGLSQTFNVASANPLNMVNPGAAVSAFPTIFQTTQNLNFQREQLAQQGQGQLLGAFGGLAGTVAGAYFGMPGLGAQVGSSVGSSLG